MVEDKVQISVIMAFYNEVTTIEEAINSFIDQDLVQKELICVNDGSLDGSDIIVRKYADCHSNIKLICQENMGAGIARNNGISEARGEYLCFLDADDYYTEKDALRRLYAFANHEGLNACAGLLSIDKEGNISQNMYLRNILKDKKSVKVDFNKYQYDYQYQCFIFKRSFITERCIIFPNYRRYQDPPFLARALYEAGYFYIIDSEFYTYRYNERKINYTNDKVNDLLKGLIHNLEFSKKRNLEKLLKLTVQRINNDYYDAIYNSIKCGNNEAKELLSRASALTGENFIAFND